MADDFNGWLILHGFIPLTVLSLYLMILRSRLVVLWWWHSYRHLLRLWHWLRDVLDHRLLPDGWGVLYSICCCLSWLMSVVWFLWDWTCSWHAWVCAWAALYWREWSIDHLTRELICLNGRKSGDARVVLLRDIIGVSWKTWSPLHSWDMVLFKDGALIG